MKLDRGTANTDRNRKQPGLLVDVKLYARMKALAALRGLRIGDVVDDAMKQYLARQEDRI